MTRPKAVISRTEERRTTAELADDGEVIAPQVYVRADEGAHGAAIEAVTTAVAENPNAVDAPSVTARDSGDWGTLDVLFRPSELPVFDDEECKLKGWLPPYRAEEEFRESIMAHLPDGWTLETLQQGHFVLAEE